MTGRVGPGDVHDYHIHVYFRNADERARALALRTALEERFADFLFGRVWDRPVGPHPVPMYQVSFLPDRFGTLIPWLMLARNGLAILVHPQTGDDVADHSLYALWLGEILPLDLEFLKLHAGG
jgi:DOPA 4,5-dioxygenase